MAKQDGELVQYARIGLEQEKRLSLVRKCSKHYRVRTVRPSPVRSAIVRLQTMLAPLSFLTLFAAATLLPIAQPARTDQFTPVLASPLTSATQAVKGTDGKYHVVYELVIANAKPATAILQKVEILNSARSSPPLAIYAGEELLGHLRTLGNTAGSREIEFNGTRLLLIDVAFGSAAAIPSQLEHRLGVLAPPPADPAPVSMIYTVAPIHIASKLPEIGPPLSGKGWVAVNGCCGAIGVHRSTGLPINGGIHFAQRFAIDWMRLDEHGTFVHGDAGDVRNYTSYGADVLAVAEGTVVETLNTLDDQIPGKLPDPRTITLENVDGNHIVIDLGDGVFAFYAHLQKGSIRVRTGERVKAGQVLSKLGNTGNTSAPHLHFHLMDGRSVLGSNGIPYVINGFAYAGQVPAAKLAAAPGIEGKWDEDILSTPSLRRGQLPLNLAVINFSK